MTGFPTPSEAEEECLDREVMIRFCHCMGTPTRGHCLAPPNVVLYEPRTALEFGLATGTGCVIPRPRHRTE